MTDRPQRKRIRLTDYDYSAPGAYFITICTREKRCILSRISAGAAVVLSTEGQFVDRAIKNISVIYPGIAVDDYVIMPNHVHILLRIMEQKSGRLIAAPTAFPVFRFRTDRACPPSNVPDCCQYTSGSRGSRFHCGRCAHRTIFAKARFLPGGKPTVSFAQRPC